jgi:hypothetical protein
MTAPGTERFSAPSARPGVVRPVRPQVVRKVRRSARFRMPSSGATEEESQRVGVGPEPVIGDLHL